MPYLKFGDEPNQKQPVRLNPSDLVDPTIGEIETEGVQFDKDGHIVLVDDTQTMETEPVIRPSTSARSRGARNRTNTVSLSTVENLTVMHWNVQTLGGGPGRAPLREQAVIDAIAEVILTVGADVCVITEVMRYGRAPSKPQVYKVNGTIVPRMERIQALKKIAAPIAKDILKALKERYGQQGQSSSSGGETQKDIVFMGVGHLWRLSDFKNLYDPSAWDRTNEALIVDRMISNSIGFSGKLVEMSADTLFAEQLELAIEDHDAIGDFPLFYDFYLKQDETVEMLLADFHCEIWYQLPAQPYTKHLQGFEREWVEKRFEIADAIQRHFHERLLFLYAAAVLKVDRPDESEIKKLRAEFQRFLARLQVSDEDNARRNRIYDQMVSAWDEAHKLTSHPGAFEVQRILKALRDKTKDSGGWSAWPSTHEPNSSDVNGDRKEALLDGPDMVEAGMLYTVGETYGVLYRHQDRFGDACLSLRRIMRPKGFQKRAPFRFTFRYRDIAPIHIWAWHAPSNSLSNQSARALDFLKLTKLINDMAAETDDPILLVGDFNINTASSGVSNCLNKLSSPLDFFGELAPEDPRGSLYWGYATSLRRCVVSTQDESTALVMAGPAFSSSSQSPKRRFDLTASPFDWVWACGNTRQFFDIDWETIVPVHLMLAGRSESGQMYIDSPGMRRSRSTYSVTGVPGLSGLFGERQASDPYSYNPSAIAADLLRRVLRISDHLPVATRYIVPKLLAPKNAKIKALGKGQTTTGSSFFYEDEFETSFTQLGQKSYKNKGGGDCLFHAILHMIESRMEEYEGGIDPYPIDYPAGTRPQDGDLDTRIAALRQHVHDEILANPWTYIDFRVIGDPGLDQIAHDLNQMHSWDHIGGDIAPLAIANVLGARFGIRTAGTGDIQPVNPRGDDGNDLGDAPYINYNGHNHYW